MFVCSRARAVPGILQSQLFTQSPGSWKQRKKKKNSLHVIKIAKETTVHMVIIQCTDIKIKHSDRQYYHKSQERQDIWKQGKEENALTLF